MMFALPALVALPFFGGLAAWLAGLRGPARTPWLVSLVTLVLQALLLVDLSATTSGPGWRAHFAAPWVSMLGIDIRFDMDGVSLVLLWLNLLIAIPTVLLCTRNVTDRPGLYQFLLLATIAGVNGVFLSTDMFLFFCFWELMLLPLFGVLLIWGHADRARVTLKFFLFTQGSGLLMLLSILALAVINAHDTGVLTFNYFVLAQVAAHSFLAPTIMLGFLIAFAVKMPMLPFHVWQPDTYAESPTAASVLLAGILSKTGAYGMIRFVAQMFPAATAQIAPLMIALGVIGILYCAWLAVAQDDVKRVIAYSSISHLGYIVLGVFSGTVVGTEGAVIQMVAHGLSTGALFIIAGLVEERTGTRDMRRLGGLWPAMPQFSAFAMFFTAASLGLPGIGNFVGEFMTLLGAWQISHVATFFAAFGAVLSSVYALTMMKRIFYGPVTIEGSQPLGAPSTPHLAVLGVATVLLLVLGFYPQPVLDLSTPGSLHPQSLSLAEEPAR